MIAEIGYGIMCLLWGAFAVRMQIKIGYPKTFYNALPLVFLANTVFAPVALVIAIIKCRIKLEE